VLLRESPVEHPCVSEILENHGRSTVTIRAIRCRSPSLNRQTGLRFQACRRGSVSGVFAVLVVPCDGRDLMWLLGEASPDKWGRLHSYPESLVAINVEGMRWTTSLLVGLVSAVEANPFFLR
jgi:hypothetical protein